MEEDSGQTPGDSGSPRFAKKITVKWERPSDSPTFDEMSADFTKKGNELEKQITNSKDYGEIMLWHRRLDAILTDAIRATFAPATKTAADQLMHYPGGLAFFAARAHLGRCLGLYGGTTYADLKIINDIRNGCAHPRDDEAGELELFGFDHPWIAGECEKLKFLETSPMTKQSGWSISARDRYQQTTSSISFGLWAQHLVTKGWSDGKHPPWPGLLP